MQWHLRRTVSHLQLALVELKNKLAPTLITDPLRQVMVHKVQLYDAVARNHSRVQ